MVGHVLAIVPVSWLAQLGCIARHPSPGRALIWLLGEFARLKPALTDKGPPIKNPSAEGGVGCLR